MKLDRVVRVVIDTGIADTGIEFKDFKIEFRITKTESSDPNECELSIYNLNPDSRSLIDLKASISIFAGYTEDTGDELLFTGNIININNKYNIPDIITKISAMDGEKKLNETKIVYSFKEGVSIAQIIQKVFDKFNLPIKTKALMEPLKKLKFNNGNAFMGKAKKVLDTLFAGVNMQWSIQNGEIKFYDDSSYDQSFAIELTTETGLIGSPEKIKIKKSKRDDSPEIEGWVFNSLLEPKIEPGGIVQAKSKEITEISKFKVINTTHIGNSIEGDFITTCETAII